MSEMRASAHRTERRSLWPRRLVVVGMVLVVFVLGVAIGQALNDGPPSPATETYVRTLTTPEQSGTSTGP